MRMRSAEKKTAKPAPPKQVNPFRYGWRDVEQIGPNGRIEWVQVPLTLKDVLHPQEGDVIPEIPRHQRERDYLARVLRCRPSPQRKVFVMSDCLINWGVKGMGNHSPDVSVFADLSREPNLDAGTFRVVEYGARCLLAIELVSPDTRVNDVHHKFAHYHQVGVRLYVIADQRREGGPRELLAYRWTRRQFVAVRPDAQGRIPVRALGITLGLVDNRVWAFDLETGARLPDAEEMTEELDRTRVEVEQLRRDNERLEAELRRARGEAAE